jgi:DNA polymerase-4
MDAFFVEVERLRRAELIGRPVAVGGPGGRGVIASASYEARRFGVTSAMPTGRALRLCPGLVVVPADHVRYRAVSEELFIILRGFTPLVEGVSVDEAFLDVSGLRMHFPDSVTIGRRIRDVIQSSLGLPASVGVGANKMIAKLASQAAKPNGVFRIAAAEQATFLHGLPVRALAGVGEATHAALEKLGVSTVGELTSIPIEVITSRLGSAVGTHLVESAMGRDPRPVVPDSAAKSVSVAHTYETDLLGLAAIEAELGSHCERLGHRLRRAGLTARTVTVKVRFADFENVTRSVSHRTGTAQGRTLLGWVLGLTAKIDLARPVRLLGVGGSGLEPADAPHQLGFDRDPRSERLTGAVDAVRSRFGDTSLKIGGRAGHT